tara:strand:+ start:434 stop:1132 length:699 start_codon:yes stop_codon:yes gene_type:complete
MSLVKKKIQEIKKKKLEKKKKQKQKQSNKPIEVFNIYKNLIKKNSIFKDLKELKNETKKNTPHFFYNLNDNSNDYLAKLKKINFNNSYSYLNSADSEKKEWFGCIIFADVYCRIQRKTEDVYKDTRTGIHRIGFSIDDKDFKPNSWFFAEYDHSHNVEKIYDYLSDPFKTYDKMMSNFIEKLMSISCDKNNIFGKPVSGSTSFFRNYNSCYEKSYGFTDSINMMNFHKIHSQ